MLPARVGGGWVLRLRLWGLDTRTGIDCSEDILNVLVQHNSGILGKSLGLQQRQEIIAMKRTLPSWVLEVEWAMAVDCDTRGRYAKAHMSIREGLPVTEVCNHRGGNTCQLAATRDGVSSRGGGQEVPVVPISGIEATTKLWVGTDHCPHFPSVLWSLPLLRDPRPKAYSPGETQKVPQTVANSHRPWPQLVLHTHPNCICLTPPSCQPDWASEPWYVITLVWVGNRNQKTTYKQRWSQNQSWEPGVVWLKTRKGIHFCSSRWNRLNPHNFLWILECNCELWKQVQAWVRSDLSLSWPHSTHSRSRDLCRNIGGLPE